VSVCLSVCPSVRLSVHLSYAGTESKIIIVGSCPRKIVFDTKFRTLRHKETPRASNETAVGKSGKNVDFRPINRYIPVVIMED